ncbi:MAG: radical SAM protein [Nanoarchaeota archaeon]|nr:radical SAM protein [Nanoarchaeota archaeon]MBU1623299.1 radical SAM protein [Nanoarchaeota archaeon]MBU1974065.1 radical SAM protein [Nanoarchaeota archaeon]
MHYTILDCYTDEASGLGVPPYLGTYPRYIYGKLISEGHSVKYLTIDDLRLWKKYKGLKREPSVKQKTNILVYNLTKNDAEETLKKTNRLVVILGVHVPGKYLTALPGTLKEVIPLLKEIRCEKILTGPAIHGTQLEGGKFHEKEDLKLFSEVKDYCLDFAELNGFLKESTEIITQIPDRRVIEIETGRGCKVGKCSFCTEPLKNRFVNRKMEDVIEEVKLYYDLGARFFRLGKQADFYASDRPIEMLKQIRKKCSQIEMLHIDNVNPNSVISKEGEEITKAIVKYCTSGNIAAFGVESFDPEVVKANLLNTAPLVAMKAIKLINKYGAERGENGLPKFLPGINIIFGLLNETKQTHKYNMEALLSIIEDGLLLRRINLRQVAVLPDTFIQKHGGNKFLRKNKKYYWKWRNDIRQKIDNPLLKSLVPLGTVLKDVYTEMYDGKTTFCRQMGTYPLVIGVKGRLPLNEKINVKVVGHMLRSIVGEVIE